MHRCLWRAIKHASAMESRISNASVAARIPRFVLARFFVRAFVPYCIQDIAML